MSKKFKIFMIYRIFSSLIFTRGIFLLFLLQEKNMTFLEVSTYQAIFFISTTLFEIPTGVIGDKFGKVNSLIIGSVLLTVQTILVLLMPSGNALLLFGCAALQALAYTFISGSDGALLFEILENEDNKERYLSINARLLSLSSAILGCAILIGGIISNYSWQGVYLLTIFTSVMSCLALFFLRDKNELIKKETSALDDAVAIKRFNFKNIIGSFKVSHLYSFFAFIIGFCILDGLFATYFNLNQIILEDFKIENAWIGIFFSALYFISALSYQLATVLHHYFTTKKIMILTLILMAGLFLMLPLTTNRLLILLISVLVCFFPEMLYILVDNIIQENITSDYRATILSIISLITSLSSSFFYVILGFVHQDYGSKLMINLIGVFVLFSVICFCMMNSQLKIVVKEEIKDEKM
ncbi:MFS transporter [Bacilli bacterium]|nr:MFS transporter [Bacilli bacterium]GHU42354.1 MFS transporter [Bacilli bacterium]